MLDTNVHVRLQKIVRLESLMVKMESHLMLSVKAAVQCQP
jgi:hypothetical protein